MKSAVKISIVVALIGIFVFTWYFLFKNSGPKEKKYDIENPFVTNIVRKTVATGSVIPRKEVNIKPNVSGVVDKIFVEAGKPIKIGQVIARIRIIPNVVNLNTAESNVNRSKIALEDAEREKLRYEKLLQDKLIAEAEYNRYLLTYNRAVEDLRQAENHLQLIREGVRANDQGIQNNLVRSTVNGMLLDIPIREGSYVIESNTFNEGTTIASVADMNDMIFVGKVDESEVGKIKEGMSIDLSIGAIEDKKFKAVLEFISPKGVQEEGAIKFEVKAALQLRKDEFIRAGYSANADIIFDRKDSVLAIREAVMQFGGEDSVYVELKKEKGEQVVFEKRIIKTGVSDGINIEILSGLQKEDQIKVAQVTEGVLDNKTNTNNAPRNNPPRSMR